MAPVLETYPISKGRHKISGSWKSIALGETIMELTRSGSRESLYIVNEDIVNQNSCHYTDLKDRTYEESIAELISFKLLSDAQDSMIRSQVQELKKLNLSKLTHLMQIKKLPLTKKQRASMVETGVMKIFPITSHKQVPVFVSLFLSVG